MSGLEPLVALGLACNILQIVDIAKQSVTICRNILESGSVDPALNTRTRDLTKICEELKSQQQVATGASCTTEQQELVTLAQSTIDTTAELKSAIDKLSSASSKGRLLGAVKGTLKAAWRKSKLEKLERNMLDTQRILETRLLVRVCSQNDALAIKQREDFTTLGDKFCTFISNYEQGKRDMESLLHEKFTSVETHVTAEAAQTRVEISTKIEDLKVVVRDKDNEDARRLLASLRYPSLNERRNQISGTHEGTFEWIFGSKPESEGESESSSVSESKDSVFINWLQSPDQPLFWISGKPGAGKSTLMKFVLEDDRTRGYLNRVHPNTLLISHFLWNSGDPTQRSLKGLLCSLLHQLVASVEEMPRLLLAVSKISQLKLKETPGDWSVDELKAALVSILTRPGTSFFILVDGLDEIDTADGPFVLLDVITQIRHIPGVKMLVSSRPEPAFLTGLQNVPSLRVQDLTRRGIFRYCKDRLASFVDRYTCAINDLDIDRLAHNVSDRADGVFLWASLALKSLERGFSNGDSEAYLQKRLEGLPDDLNALYKNMWDRLNEDEKIYREEAAKYLNFAILSLDIVDSLESSNGLFIDTIFYPYAIVQLLAVEAHMTNRIIEELDIVTDEDIQSIHDKLSAFLQAITVRCAGILEIHQVQVDPHEMGERFGKGGSFATIGFVHRSAREFLSNTSYGLEILQHDSSTPQDRFLAFLKACMARDRLLTTSVISGILGGARLEARYYTYLCCDPNFGLSLQEILDIMDCMEKQNMFMSRETSLAVDKMGMLVLANHPDAAISSLEKAERSNGPVSANYLNYLLMLAIQGFWLSYWASLDEPRPSRVTTISSLISSGRKVNTNARVPAIDFGWEGPPLVPRPVTAETYANSPLLDLFLSKFFRADLSAVPPHLLNSTVQICCMFLGLKPMLETRTLLVLERLYSGEYGWKITRSSSVEHWDLLGPIDLILLEVDTRFLLGLLCQRLAPQVRDDDQMVLSKLALFRTAISERPGWIEVVGVFLGGLGPGRKVIVPNKKQDASTGQGSELDHPGCIKSFEDLEWVTEREDRKEYWYIKLLGCPNTLHLIDSFEYGTREVELGQLQAEFVERGLIVTHREVNSDTWPPPKYHDSSLSGTMRSLANRSITI